MGKDIEVSTSQKDNIAIVSIKGDVTAATAGVIGETYQVDAIANSPNILFRFDKECYINSGGLATLIDISSQARKKKQQLHACGLSDHFQKIFQMIGLTRCITVFPSEQEALAKF